MTTAIACFKEKVLAAAPEIALCSVRRTTWRKYQAIWIDVPAKFVSIPLWQERDALKRAAIECGLTGAIVIMWNGQLCRSPIEAKEGQVW